MSSIQVYASGTQTTNGEYQCFISVGSSCFYRLYYRYDEDRLPACPLTIHAFIHIPNDTRNAGPLSRIWEFVTERIMGLIGRSIKSKRYPFSQLAKSMKKMEQLKLVAMKYELWDFLKLDNRRRNWDKLQGDEIMYPDISKFPFVRCLHPLTYLYGRSNTCSLIPS